jgi:hypothetical protein
MDKIMINNRIKRFNENSELNIYDVSENFTKKSSMKKFLEDDENRFVWDIAIDFAKWLMKEGIEKDGELWKIDLSFFKSGSYHNSLVDDEELFKLFLENYH